MRGDRATVTLRAAAQMLGVRRQTVWSLIQRGHLRARLVGADGQSRGIYLVNRRAVEDRLKTRPRKAVEGSSKLLETILPESRAFDEAVRARLAKRESDEPLN